MKRIVVIVPEYPSEGNRYTNVFVHSRVLNYIANDIEVAVFSLTGKMGNYVYESVSVNEGNAEDLKAWLKSENYEKIIIHVGIKKLLNAVLSADNRTPILLWVHGYEALAWYRRFFKIASDGIVLFCGYILLNLIQLLFMRKLIKMNKSMRRVKFIFVSKWMKDILEQDTFCVNEISDYEIIPNVIDSKVFPYKEKVPKDRLKVLSIRPYFSKKYANDIMVDGIMEFSKTDIFNEFEFTIFGQGKLFEKTLKPLRSFANVNINNEFLNHKQIKNEHSKHGVMLIPTRQDAQGVSMCEAMSSGLVAIASNNTAIPEFINNECGYLTSNPREISEALIDLYNNPDKFLTLSQKGSEFIRGKCSEEVVISKELELINNS